MKKLVILAIFVLTVFSLNFVKAQDESAMSLGATFEGQTGLILVPTAESLGAGQLRVALKGYTLIDDTNVIVANDRYTLVNYTLTAAYGITTNLEVGIGANTLASEYKLAGTTTSDSDSSTLFNAKYNIYPEASDKDALFAVAATREEYKSQVNNTNYKQIQTSVYGIASKLFDETGNFKGTIGAGWSQIEYKTTGQTDTKDSGAYYFAGLEYKILPNLGLSVEYVADPKDNDPNTKDRTIAYGLRYGFTPSFNLEIGAVDTGGVAIGSNSAKGKPEIFVGLGYTFGGK